MIKRFAVVAGAATLLAVAGASSAGAAKPKPKPLGYGYGQCTSASTCTFQASANPTQKKISISSTAVCQTGDAALAQVGFVAVKRGGKFTVKKTVKVEDNASYKVESVQVQFSGTLKPGKRVVGSLKVTTTASDCAMDTGVAKAFSMKYMGPFYGG
jgi:hypothetical protein